MADHVPALVAVDLASTAELDRLAGAIWDGTAEGFDRPWRRVSSDYRAKYTEQVKRALEAYARPAEPSTWGVVEASCVHAPQRRHWVRYPDGGWYAADLPNSSSPDDWESLRVPTVIRDGIEEGLPF